MEKITKTSAGIIAVEKYDDTIAKGILVYLNGEIVCALDVYEPQNGECDGEARVLVYKDGDDEPICITVNR